ncbi:hypothetical protein [Hyphomonas sp.]|uniref:hypothetical protein n=1 Tax=Hyphomonas sp. TaxID=87 RepID=UPI00391C58D1
MKRIFIGGALALGLAVAACGGSQSDKAAIAKACMADGENEAFCNCVADGMERDLDAETFKAFAKASGPSGIGADELLENLPEGKQMQVVGALMNVGMTCALGG